MIAMCVGDVNCGEVLAARDDPAQQSLRLLDREKSVHEDGISLAADERRRICHPVWSKKLERRKNHSSLDDRACRAPELGQRSSDRSAQNQNSRLNLGRAVTLRLGDNSAAAHPIARGIEQAAGRGG